MLRTLFPRHYPRYEQSCRAGELEKFGCWLLDAGYSRKNTRDHLRRLRFVVEQTPQRLSDKMYSAEQLVSLFALPHEPAWRSILNSATRRLYERFLHSKGRLDPGKQFSDPYTACLDDYAHYLRDVRGLAQTTTAQHLSVSLRPACTTSDRSSD